MNCSDLKNTYLEWLNKEITINKIDEYFEMTTPFLDRFNDYLQIYIKMLSPDKLFISDDSYIINNLLASGIDINSNKRKAILESILKKYGVELYQNELIIYADIHDLPQKKHFLLQAMLNIDDMFMLSQNKIVSLFLDDIQAYFDSNDIFYSENVSFTGKSGFIHIYDYLLQRTKKQPERLCKAINNATRSNMESTLFTWDDTKETRKEDSKLIVLLNDENRIERGIVEAFNRYDVDCVLWSEKDKYKDKLAS